MKCPKKSIIVFLVFLVIIIDRNIYTKSYFKKESFDKTETIKEKIEKKEVEVTPINYSEYKVNEMGNIPIMMYHKIVNIEKESNNVDKNGYNRTKKGFIGDLEFYYENNYRMIRLKDYIEGNIDTKLGYSPIILTFDDGNIDNIKVIGKNEDGTLIIDPNSAVGILEQFKEKYPDYNVTATFFLNKGLFGQPMYNSDIINWLIENGYDIGNHTYNHLYLDKVSGDKVQEEISLLYNKLDEIIKDKYINVIALPYGLPSNKNHKNFKYIKEGSYKGTKYENSGALRVGWDSNVSPYSKDFDPFFIKRVRAYDNNGKDFDIQMTFKLLENNRFISDGDKDTIVVKDDINIKENIDKKVVKYE